MNTVQAISWYIAVNVSLAFTGALLWLICRANSRLVRPMPQAQLLRMSYALVVAALAVTLLPNPLSAPIWVPQAQVWSATTAKKFLPTLFHLSAPKDAVIVGAVHAPLHLDLVTEVLLFLLLTGCLLVAARLWWDHRLLKRIYSESFLLRRLGSVVILSHPQAVTPFSAWSPGRSVVVVPQNLISNPLYLHIVIKHELQHHRQGDTRWIYVLQMVRAFCFWNPFLHVLQKNIADLQELACDEALTGPRSVSRRAYCDCLLWVAQNTLLNRVQPVGTAAFARGSAAKILARRIEEMTKVQKKQVSHWLAAGTSLLAAGLLTVGAAASQSSIKDRRITRVDAEKMAAAAHSEEFPVVVNDLVLEQLNRFLGTPDGRKFLRGSLERMKDYEQLITSYLDQYQLPRELLAVPLVESGYRNLAQDENPAHGAGIWMFIRSTARNFGLRVDHLVDERLEADKETDAAMRYLKGSHLQFRDWGLAILSYNAGPGLVNRAVRETGSRDVWELIRRGYGNDPGYVASVMAVVLILKNPSYLD